MGVFDNLGFKYFFNFAIIVLFIKLIFYIFTHRIKIKYPIILFGILFLFLYDCLNAMINNLFSLSYLGNFNIWITYLILFLTISIFFRNQHKKDILLLLYWLCLQCIFMWSQCINEMGLPYSDSLSFCGNE